MEKTENQLIFAEEFKKFVDSIVINDDFDRFIELFKKHKYFDYCRKTIEEMEKDVNYGKQGVKLFIFGSLTRDRETCAAIAKLLREANLNKHALRLEQFNASSGPWELSWNVELAIAKRPSPIKNLSGSMTLLKKQRGRCVIINNMEEPQWPPYDDHGEMITPMGLKRETERFRYIFTQLYFTVHVLTDLSADKIKEELTKISKDKSLEDDEAFVLIVLSHGENEFVLGSNACEALRNMNFGQIKIDDTQAREVIMKDRVQIKDLVDLFSGKDSYLNSKPKLHFYICCREKNDSDNNPGAETNVKFNETKPRNKQYNDTYVSYACSEGSEAYYNVFYGLSYFGQALTHSLAQYACDYPFSEVMTRTSKRLKLMYSEWEQNPKAFGGYGIEVNNYDTSFQLYFNPGHFEE